jgi:CSLREA domain-containing protein
MKKLIAMRLLVPRFSDRIPKLLLLVVLIILAVPHFASSATFTVNSTADANDVSPGDGVCETAPGNDVCTLRAAIQESNAVPGFPPAQINVLSGTYVLMGGQLEIRSGLFLKGADQKTTFIDGSLTSRVLRVFGDDGPTVNISDVTIQNGRGGPGLPGGGLRVDQGAFVNLARSTVQNNRTSAPGGGANLGFLQLVETTVRDNHVPTFGMPDTGGVQHSDGGIANSGAATLKIIDSAIVDNSAARGGGIRNLGGHMEISNSTISGNSALARGGGIMNFGTAWIAFSTITNNETDGVSEHPDVPSGGGGIYNDPGDGSDGLTVARVDIGNSIVAGNRDNRSSFSNNYSPDCFSVSPSTFTSFRGNLVGIVNTNCNLSDTIFGAPPPFDMVGTPASPLNPRLAVLSDNGGPTQTHALLSNSPAIDQGTGVTSATFFDCSETDQRGLTRPVDGNSDGKADCDIGAFEFGAIPPETVNNRVSQASELGTSLSTIPTPDGTAGTFFITATFTNTSNISIRKPFFQVVELSGGNVLINADSGPEGVGATLTPDVGPDRLLTPGESVIGEFRIGLQTLNPFTFFVDVMGEPTQ